MSKMRYFNNKFS